jgi:hypothetical protein
MHGVVLLDYAPSLVIATPPDVESPLRPKKNNNKQKQSSCGLLTAGEDRTHADSHSAFIPPWFGCSFKLPSTPAGLESTAKLSTFCKERGQFAVRFVILTPSGKNNRRS